MNPSDDLDQLARWHERLPLYARTQGSYMNELMEQGFDAEQAFLLVRDWSSRTMYWACDARSSFPTAPDFVPLDNDDPSVAPSGESYLIGAEAPAGAQPLRPEDLADLTNVVQLDASAGRREEESTDVDESAAESRLDDAA